MAPHTLMSECMHSVTRRPIGPKTCYIGRNFFRSNSRSHGLYLVFTKIIRKRELQNSLWRPNLMILVSVWFLVNRHILLAIGDLQEIQSRRQKGKFGRKWSFAIPSKVQLKKRGTYEISFI